MTKNEHGFTLMEMMVAVAVTLVILAGTMRAVNDAMRASETAQLVTSMNRGLRTAADIMVRDLLQVGQGLPPTHVIQIPQGGTATAVKLPAPPSTLTRVYATSVTEISAVVPGPALGPTVNGVVTDMITTLAVDSAFESIAPASLAADNMKITSVPISGNVATEINPGDLLMIVKGSASTLVEVTNIDANNKTVNFSSPDSLSLNQTTGTLGTVQHLIDADVKNDLSNVLVSRVRMISYYLDNVTEAARPRLVRRMNNGDPVVYDNKLGTAVAFDVENLQISYDLVDGVNNWANVKMTETDIGGTGACSPKACNPNQIRKINITLTGRSRTVLSTTKQYFRNTLNTQVSLRSMAFVDKYK